MKRPRGGHRRQRRDGYIEVRIDDGTWVFEHRLVYERHLGRKLRPEEVIHHEDNVRSRNDLSNLKLFANQAEHARYHALRGDTINDETRAKAAARNRKERTPCPVDGTPFLQKRLPSGKLQQTCRYACSLVLFPTAQRFAGG